MLVVVLFAVATYYLIRVIERRGVTGLGGRSQPGRQPGTPPRTQPRTPPRAERRPAAPDDDEDFLRDLDRRRRHPEDPDVT